MPLIPGWKSVPTMMPTSTNCSLVMSCSSSISERTILSAWIALPNLLVPWLVRFLTITGAP